MKPLSECKNIGTTILKKLNDVGIYSIEDLRKTTPVVAYIKICKQNKDSTVPLCYYLYSLQGALTNTHWKELSWKTKEQLKNDAKNHMNKF